MVQRSTGRPASSITTRSPSGSSHPQSCSHHSGGGGGGAFGSNDDTGSNRRGGEHAQSILMDRQATLHRLVVSGKNPSTSRMCLMSQMSQMSTHETESGTLRHLRHLTPLRHLFETSETKTATARARLNIF
jgi:hypothetical protein